MTPKTSDAIKFMVQKKTGLNHQQSRKVARMMEVKFDIEEGNTKSALNHMLELMLRGEQGFTTTLDDLTKLLNTEVPRADNMTARQLLEKDWE